MARHLSYAECVAQPAKLSTVKENGLKKNIKKKNVTFKSRLYHDVKASSKSVTSPRVLLLHDSVMKKINGKRLGLSCGLQVAARKVCTIDQCTEAIKKAKDDLMPEPDCIAIHVGLNDIKTKEPTTSSADLEKCVKNIKTEFPRAKVVVSQIAPVSNDKLNVNRELLNAHVKARLLPEKGISYINHDNLRAADHKYVSQDEVHPTSRGTSVLARNLGQHLHRLFWERPRRRPASSYFKLLNL